MGKRYYCDYCDRLFVDDIQARKKHVQGSGHVRNYKQHYQKYQDVKSFLEEETKKEECYKFLKTGVCAYGDNCFRSHFSRHQLKIFRDQYEAENYSRTLRNVAEINTLKSWLQKKNSSMVALEDLSQNQKGMTSHASFYPNYFSYLPQSLQNIRFLKPADLNVAEWG